MCESTSSRSIYNSFDTNESVSEGEVRILLLTQQIRVGTTIVTVGYMIFFEHRQLLSRQVSCCYETQNCSRRCRLLSDHIVSQMAINMFDIVITDLCKKFLSSPPYLCPCL